MHGIHHGTAGRLGTCLWGDSYTRPNARASPRFRGDGWDWFAVRAIAVKSDIRRDFAESLHFPNSHGDFGIPGRRIKQGVLVNL